MIIIVILLLFLAGAFLLIAVALFPFIIYSILVGEFKDAPYVPSKKEKAALMLNLAAVQANEIVMDLGSGNGILLIESARRGAQAVGIEINPFLVWWSRLRAFRAGLKDKTRVICGDFNKHSLREADVVFLYLRQKTNETLRPKLEKELKPGARVVSNTFTLPGWTPHKEENQVFLYQL